MCLIVNKYNFFINLKKIVINSEYLQSLFTYYSLLKFTYKAIFINVLQYLFIIYSQIHINNNNNIYLYNIKIQKINNNYLFKLYNIGD
jgi:hypothetical protein